MSRKTKKDHLNHLLTLFTDSELLEAGISDGHEYVADFLTLEEIRDYIKFFNTEMVPVLSPIKKLRKGLPDHVWKNYKIHNVTVPETRKIKELQSEVRASWRKLPRIPDRVIEKLTKAERKSDKKKKVNNES